MAAFTPEEISMIGEEISNLSDDLRSEALDNIDSNYYSITNTTQGIRTCEEACNKINKMNKDARSLQKETMDICNSIVELINNSQVVNNNRNWM